MLLQKEPYTLSHLIPAGINYGTYVIWVTAFIHLVYTLITQSMAYRPFQPTPSSPYGFLRLYF